MTAHIHDDGAGGVSVRGEGLRRGRGDSWGMHKAIMYHTIITDSVSQYMRICVRQNEHFNLLCIN